MNNNFIKHALSYGSEGKKWLKQIPDIIRTYESKWRLKAMTPYNLNYNYTCVKCSQCIEELKFNLL